MERAVNARIFSGLTLVPRDAGSVFVVDAAGASWLSVERIGKICFWWRASGVALDMRERGCQRTESQGKFDFVHTERSSSLKTNSFPTYVLEMRNFYPSEEIVRA